MSCGSIEYLDEIEKKKIKINARVLFTFLSRTSHDVSSLLNAMSVDPEEFLADLGFAESDMSMRIPDRFLEAPSKAHGIDVEFYRRSFDQEDLYGGSPVR